ncbi:hypothetical protein RRG08_015147 [Elysia crispata]|uniref:Cytochrome P450 n=1 Tax=Elysia crispata TaxID=231223 RepID=A0AAE1B266_9GAST|nr:hypothetical protein RRG08_015147 [Elysia crispata]
MVFETLLGFELPPLAIVAVALVVILVVNYWASSPPNIPPFPARPYPILGHLVYLRKDARHVVMDWTKQTGEIFSLYMGTTLVVVLSSYDLMKDVLVKQANIYSDRPILGTLPVLPKLNGIVGTSGSLWKENRTVVLSILRQFGMGKNVMAEKIEEEVHAYLDEVEKMDGKPADLKDLTGRAVSNVICSCVLGKRFDYNDAFYRKFLKMFDDTIEGSSAGTLHLWFPQVKYLPGDFFKAKLLLKNDAVFDTFIEEMIQNVDDEDAEGINKNSIVAHYLKEMREKREKGIPTEMSEDGLGRVIADLMTAGTETTTTTIRWFYIYMIHNQQAQRKVHEEIDENVGSGRNPKITDRPRMPYLNAAIMETQRIASILPFGLFHRCTEETTLRGYTIPKDTLIMPHLDAVLLSEKIWGDPLNFRPERFIGPQGNLLNPEQLAPFSMGRRLCLGEALAKAELFLFLAHVMHRYQVAPESPDSLPTFDSVLGISMAPAAHNIRLVRRDGAMDHSDDPDK